MLDAMEFKEIDIANFGPIRKGVVGHHKINVFFGPNNSGKSLVSRMIHGINSLDTKSVQSVCKRYKFDITSNFYTDIIARTAGIPLSEVITHGKKECTVGIKRNKKPLRLIWNKTHNSSRVGFLIARILHYMNTRKSVYVPAGRTGTIQYFTSIMQVRNRMLNDVLATFGSGGIIDTEKTTSKDIKKFTASLSRLPTYLEQFYDLVLSSHADGLNSNAQTLFSDVFSGSIELQKTGGGISQIVYRDPSGFDTKLESVGSGTLSAFPILAGLYYVKEKGMLIVEEPEAHIEPSKQLILIEKLVEISHSRGVSLIFTTHSDYVVKKLLALVSSKKIKPNDLGLYYFNRKDSDFTNIMQIEIDKTGEAEQPIFQDALNSLIEEFSK